MFAFVHGIGGRGTHFDPLIESLSISPEQAQTPLLPNHGEESEDGDWNALASTDWDETLRLTASHVADQITSCRVLVGHSTGGVVAMLMAAMAAGNAERLVIIDSNAPVSSDAVARKLVKADIAERPDWRVQMKHSLKRDWVGPASWRRLVFNDLDDTADLPMRWIWKAVLQADSKRLWESLNVPTLYVRSTRSLSGTEVAGVNDNARVTEVVAGHWPHIAAPDRVAAAIKQWI